VIARFPDLGPEAERLARLLVHGLDVPPQLLGLDLDQPWPPLTARDRLARHVGQAGWRAGYTVAQAGRLLERAGDRVIDAGDWLAGKVAGR
jgi:hypothetical protein